MVAMRARDAGTDYVNPAVLVSLILLLAASLPSPRPASALQVPPVRRLNAPQFSGDVASRFDETAVLWFGQVSSSDNYTDARIGYSDTEIWLRLAIFDRLLWYAPTPSVSELDHWDAVSVYLSPAGHTPGTPGTGIYRFVGQLNWWEARPDYQAAYQGNGAGWTPTDVAFTTTTGWRGNAPNDVAEDRGWTIEFRIPFTSLGLSGPPAPGSSWAMALTMHDRDDAGGAATDKTWPETMTSSSPATWGQLAFGLPTYTPPAASMPQTTTIRQGLNGASVVDAAVGGHSICGDGLQYWTQWGSANYAGRTQFNIQNQGDVADWPCFSKYYVTFPLTGVPAGKVITAATLTLHQFGNAGAPGEAHPSLIQVFSVAGDWDEASLTWNNAPLASENISQAWVDPLATFPGSPGVPRVWDVSRAVAGAYAAGQPLRLALYSADSSYHSGKYFTSSEADDWDQTARPTLEVTWGDPSDMGIVKGRVELEGRPNNGDVHVTVGSMTSLTLADGTFQLSVPAGAYTVRASHASYLKSETVVTVSTGTSISLPPVMLRAGDVNGDDAVDALDLSLIARDWRRRVGAGAPSDVDGNGVVDVRDIALSVRNRGLQGVQPWSTPP